MMILKFPSSRFIMTALLGLVVGSSLSAIELRDRGAVAFPLADGSTYVGWRLLAQDPADVVFDVYCDPGTGEPRRKVNADPISASTNVVDTDAAAGTGRYLVEAISSSADRPFSESWALIGESAEIGGMWRFNLDGDHAAHKVGLADFDGDGALDFLIKQPDSNVDPSQSGNWRPSAAPYQLEAYRSDGTFMWRYDMGWSIETGTWYSPVLAFDLDGDGRAEVYTKAGEGDPREVTGHVLVGPEYLVKLDGLTGKVVSQLDWPTREGMVDDHKGDLRKRYSYYSRNQLGLAFLDGKRPHLLVERGTYTNIKFDAYDPNLNRVWQFEAVGEYEAYRGQGAHGMQIGDIDGDGRDEIIYGAAALNDDGKPLWTTGRGHPDVCYLGDIDPERPGLEVFYGHEWAQERDGLCLVDAKTGETIWGHPSPTTHIHSQGMVADIDPNHPGMECFGGEKDSSGRWLYSAQGELLSEERMGGLSPRAVFWRDGTTKVMVGDVANGLPYHGTGDVPGRVLAMVDCLGDWREELIVSVAGEVRIYSTTIPATSRRTTLMQDRRYRQAVALQTMGYYYPAILGGELLPDLVNPEAK